MGTRSASGVIIDGEQKISYNHFDGYPQGVGQQIVDELRTAIAGLGLAGALLRWRGQARAMRMVDANQNPFAHEIGFYDLTASDVSSGKDWYSHLRDDHGSILARLNRGVATDERLFVADSLFCEWAYILDLDQAVLEVYQGFQRQPHDRGRFADMPHHVGTNRSVTYYPVALERSFPLIELPADLGALFQGADEQV